MRGKKGFTLIELILVIALLGILAVAALPQLFNVSLSTARQNSVAAVAGAVQTGISMYAANQVMTTETISWPPDLDTLSGADLPATASSSAPLFGDVLQGGVTSGWTKTAARTYRADIPGAPVTYVYSNTDHTFLSQ